jgi:hypothetical protein
MYRVFAESKQYRSAKQAEQRARELGHNGIIFEPRAKHGEPVKPARWIPIAS